MEEWRNWAVLVDPAWRSSHDDETPPATAIVGGWALDEKGSPGPFEPNPDYAPSDDVSPTDPADAVMRLIVDGRAPIDDLLPVVRDAMLELAVSEDGYCLVGPAPDGSPCVAVVTAAAHRGRVDTERWARVTAEQLFDLVPEDTDILLNPGSPASVRLLTGTLRASFAETRGQ
jgi:hypothetical protein